MSMDRPFSLLLTFGLMLLGFFAVIAVLLHESVSPFKGLTFGKHTIYLHNEVAIQVTIADTHIKRQVGLGGLEGLSPREGMLFIFNEDKKWRIWMKDMNFGIDIIWLNEEGTIVDIQEHASVESYPRAFKPQAEARYILEMIAGSAEVHTLRVGDSINLRL